jgi:oligopeptide/dipeptide ABC transporter ATP-binding protein
MRNGNKENKMKKTIAILLADGFEEIEALAPADVWRRLGFEVILTSINAAEQVTGAHGIQVKADALLADIPGTVPPPDDWPSGCAFHPRCPFATGKCSFEPPPDRVCGAVRFKCHKGE